MRTPTESEREEMLERAKTLLSDEWKERVDRSKLEHDKKSLRETIDQFDDRICKALEARQQMVEILQYVKEGLGDDAKDVQREEMIINRLKRNHRDIRSLIEPIYQHIFNDCL
jgi:chorismate mutase